MKTSLLVVISCLAFSCFAALPEEFYGYRHVCVGQHSYIIEAGTGTTSNNSLLTQLRVWPKGTKSGSTIWNPGEISANYYGGAQLFQIDDIDSYSGGTPEFCVTDKVNDGSGPYHKWNMTGVPSYWDGYTSKKCDEWTGY